MKENLAKKYMELQSDVEKKLKSGRLEGFTLSDMDCICYCGKELLKHKAVNTVIKRVADYFKRFGFMVTMDFNNVNYVIVEA
jgi:hypothetical protein